MYKKTQTVASYICWRAGIESALTNSHVCKVTGTGLGGRNQEMALRMSLALYKNADLHNITFLSAGTDGIDGPTPAAGAIGSESVISEVIETGKCLSDISFIQNNNSYHFYSSHNNAELYHIVTGHTGTNVMDLQLILLE